MIDLTTPNCWQRMDGALLMPYYTHPALEVIRKWDLKGKRIFEYGVGASTLWWRSRGAIVKGVDNNEEYAAQLGVKHVTNRQQYIETPIWDDAFDIIIVDGEPIEWRDDCIKGALEALKFGGTLVVDNWQQSSVGWLPNADSIELINDLPHRIFKQEGHPDWSTIIAWNR